MQFLVGILLICSPFLTFARVATPQGPTPFSDNACDYVRQNGSISTDCQLQLQVQGHAELRTLSPDTNASDSASAPVSRVYKSVIQDLEAKPYGYEWFAFSTKSFLSYSSVLVDELLWDVSATNSITILGAFNSETDANPSRVPLRDILMSYYAYKTGSPKRAISDLEHLIYDNVVEKHMKILMPEIYSHIGRNLKDDRKMQASFKLSATSTGGEQTAFQRVIDATPFGAGAKKMLAEYEDFTYRSLESFEFEWAGGMQLNFKVHFPA